MFRPTGEACDRCGQQCAGWSGDPICLRLTESHLEYHEQRARCRRAAQRHGRSSRGIVRPGQSALGHAVRCFAGVRRTLRGRNRGSPPSGRDGRLKGDPPPAAKSDTAMEMARRWPSVRRAPRSWTPSNRSTGRVAPSRKSRLHWQRRSESAFLRSNGSPRHSRCRCH